MASKEKQAISDSEFMMWRAVFAFSLVDNMLSMEEQKLLQTYLNAVPFSKTQLDTLKQDFKTPQDVESLYKKIANPAHKERFCVLARALVWCEGHMERQEEAILRKVACLGKGDDLNILRGTRNHPHIDDYYQHYARAGVVGMMKAQPIVTMRV